MGRSKNGPEPGSDPIREKNEEILHKLDRYRAELAHAIETGDDFYTHPFKLVKPIDKEVKIFVLALIVIALLIALKDYFFPEFR